MQTKAELEAEIEKLRLRVAELEGQVEAYKTILVNKQPETPYYPNSVWPDWQWTFNPHPVAPFQITTS